ncbi:AfsR/SARP family transcriptional regulator [Krasilnikovia sp. M28-CT-15]|uniref:AfsR/SARP family transcriptional regulator n=1 Tax=Krasilnikovia sp. M28-CT-15 TaxID=3373540 RepID=UPI003877831A
MSTGNPGRNSSGPATPQPADPAGSDHGAYHPPHSRPAGITLPGGGWIPYHTAAVIRALAAQAWLQRRRHYRPDPHRPRGHDTDPDLQPLPGTIHTVTTAVGAESTRRDRTPPPLAAERLPEGILSLTGPGAAAAARGLLVTAVLTDATRHTSVPTVSIRPGDLRTLLHDYDPKQLIAAGFSPGPDSPTGNPAVPRSADAADVVQDPAGVQERIGLRNGPATVIVLGYDPATSHRWHVTADGTATGTDLSEPRRLCSLDPHAAADLLTLVSARPETAAAAAAEPQPSPCPGPTTGPQPGQGITAGHLTVLGDCQLTVHGDPVPLRRTAGLQALAYLAVHHDGATRGDLIHAVWPDLPAATITQRLHTTLTDLRQHLRPLLGEDPITRHDDRYQLNTHAITTDLQHWHTTIQAMTHAVGTTAQQRACRNLIDMYPGELAAGRTWPWLTPIREQIRRSLIDAYSTLAHHAEPADALTWLHHAIAVDPYNEPLHHQAADLLRATGDHTGATELINRLHQRLSTLPQGTVH